MSRSNASRRRAAAGGAACLRGGALAGFPFGPAGGWPRLGLKRFEVGSLDIPVATAEPMPRELASNNELTQPLRCHSDFLRGLTQEHQFVLHAQMILVNPKSLPQNGFAHIQMIAV